MSEFTRFACFRKQNTERIVKALPSGIIHTAIFIKNDLGQSQTYYALTARPEPTDSDLYFTALIKHSAVPVHSGWKAWLYKRAVQKKEVEALTTHGIHGVKSYHWTMTSWPKTFQRHSRRES